MGFSKRLMRAHRGVQGMLATVGALGFLGALVTVMMWWSFTQVVNGVLLMNATLEQLAPILGVLMGAILARAGLQGLRDWIGQTTSITIRTQLRERLTQHVVALGPNFTRSERTGELVTTALEGVDRLDGYYARFLPASVLAALVPLVILAVAVWLDPLSALVMLVTVPLIPVFMWLLGTYAQQYSQRQFLELRRMSAHFLDVLQGLETLKLFNRGQAQTERIAAISQRFRERTMDVLRVAFLSGLALELTATISTAIVAVTVGFRLLEGYIPFDRALLVLLLAPEFYGPWRQLGLEHHAGMEASTAAERVFEVLDTPLQTTPLSLQVRDLVGAAEMMSNQAVHDQGIGLEFREVSYAYPRANQPALDSVNLRLAPGRRTALVGQSGAGKSTLAALVLRFLEPSAGTITANGVPIGALEPGVWRQYVAFVPQKPHVFNATILENLRLARPEAGLDDVRMACKWAGLLERIESLPDGFDTVLGENGSRLSGGERQRLAIARAFLKDAPILVLDEPTSNLDVDSEAHVIAALDRLMVGRTVLIVAHRLRTVIGADQIVVLRDGRVLECGGHAELVALGGEYARLVTSRVNKTVPDGASSTREDLLRHEFLPEEVLA